MKKEKEQRGRGGKREGGEWEEKGEGEGDDRQTDRQSNIFHF